jgi:S1-C subfamily serine protease
MNSVTHYIVRAVWLLAPTLLPAQQVSAPRPASASSTVKPVSQTISVLAAIVMPDMSVRPVPLHTLELLAEADSSQRTSVRTGLDGKAVTPPLAPGRYQLRSVQPISVNDSLYRWSTTIDVAGPQPIAVELTNANAYVTSAGVRTARAVAPERSAFDRVRHSVFRIEAGLGHGSGFLAAVPGLSEAVVITNDHVVANQTTASVYLDSVTRVPATVIARDRDADLAFLRLPSGRAGNRLALPLATEPPGEGVVVAGERVFAVGFPLNQEMTLTTGIVSSIRAGAIISDVNINHGNSGGPMLNIAGEVVGVNAFGDFTQQGGPGISGSIVITKLAALAARAPAALASIPAPIDRPLPAMLEQVYPVALLKGIADTATASAYKGFFDHTIYPGTFQVSVTTPVTTQLQRTLADRDVSKDRRKREAKAGIAADERFSEEAVSRDWEQYVGSHTAAVVALRVVPAIGETFWSSLGRSLETLNYGTAVSQAKMKFKGDVRNVRIWRNGVEIEPIRGGHGPQAVRVSDRWVELKDVADMGYYVLSPESFAPDSAGVPPVITIVVQDLKNPKSPAYYEMNKAIVARIWNDFGPYYQQVMGTSDWRPANPKAKQASIEFVCDGKAGDCIPKLPKSVQ